MEKDLGVVAHTCHPSKKHKKGGLQAKKVRLYLQYKP
jgi:hypothetical protein